MARRACRAMALPAAWLPARRLPMAVSPGATHSFSSQSPSEEPKAKRKPVTTLEEALYLAKLANIWTEAEVQYQIVRGPEFSRDNSPFMLENFFEVEDEPYEATASKEQFDVVGNEGEREWPNTNPTVHGTIEKYFRPDLPPKFWHGGKEWLSYVEGTGTRKRASAHVVLVRGTGIFRVNGEQDMYSRWPQIYNRVDVCQPFKLTGTAGQYDVFVATRGGGLSGQAGATRLAISRALFQANPSCHDDLQKGFCLLEDTRQRLSHLAGRAGRRAGHAWNKR